MPSRVRGMKRKVQEWLFELWPRSGTVTYRIGRYNLEIPRNHKLPLYQARNELYDRFPSFLGRHLPQGIIIDIGANIGDTAAAFATVTPNPILCVEPDGVFFELLRRNCQQIAAEGRTIRCMRHGVGLRSTSGYMNRTESTANFVADPIGPLTLVPLDEVLRLAAMNENSVSLLKVDTDGHDGAVLLSGKQLIRTFQPIIFFEADFRTDNQLWQMEEALSFLQETGYVQVTVFDNFGNVMLHEANFEIVAQLTRYCRRQNIGRATRSVFYLDLLLSPKQSRLAHVAAVNDFIRYSESPSSFRC